MPPTLPRRAFLKTSLAAAVMAQMRLRVSADEIRNGIPYRPLGSTGETVSAIGIGGFHIGHKPTEEEATRIVRTALDSGINFLDNCWDYNGGASEIRMGKALRDGYRDKAFLMSKIDAHSKAGAARQIDESLQRLQTDHVDLMQFHEVIRPGDPEAIFAPGGSFEAMTEAHQAGKVRHIGFTGHKSPDIHLHMLEVAQAHHFHFDTVQMPLNVMDAHFESFGQKVVPVAVREKIGVLGIKPLGSGWILQSKTVEPIDCLHYAMSLPTSVVITGCDSMEILNQALTAARTFKPLDQEQVTRLLAKTGPLATAGKFEGYKTTQTFDGTVQHPDWLL
ncbi:MAG TPA: aldo/keto reductase [Chthoniobacter sp.]|jgi:predicted aldo/keto reductase-like oxidoreductase